MNQKELIQTYLKGDMSKSDLVGQLSIRLRKIEDIRDILLILKDKPDDLFEHFFSHIIDCGNAILRGEEIFYFNSAHKISFNNETINAIREFCYVFNIKKSVCFPNDYIWHRLKSLNKTLCDTKIPENSDIRDGEPKDFIYYSDDECFECYSRYLKSFNIFKSVK